MLKLLVFSYLKLFAFCHFTRVRQLEKRRSRRNVQFNLVNLKLLALLCLFFNEIRVSKAKPHDPILWSMQNDMFKTTLFNDQFVDNTLEVRLGEFLNIICPHTPSTSSSSSSSSSFPSLPNASKRTSTENEYHTLYKVSKEEYDACSIKNYDDSVKTILRCDKPNENLKYTLYISTFSPVPDALEFTPGRSYYFMSTSDGTLNGLNNLNGGSCKDHNMKFVIKVLDTSTSSKSQVTTTKKFKQKQATTTLKIKQPPVKASAPMTSTVFMPKSTSTTSTEPSVLTSYFYKAAASAHLADISTKTVIYHNLNDNKNDNDIFLLEPDSIDYGDLLSQFISIGNNSEKNKNLRKFFNNQDKNAKSKNATSSLKEYELTHSASSSTVSTAALAVFFFNLIPVYFFIFMI